MPNGKLHQSSDPFNFQFLNQVIPVSIYSARANEQLCPNFSAGKTLGDQLQYIQFPLAQAG
jgi:hypothetical protein